MVRNIVYHIMRNPHDVDDITQEVLIKAYQSLDAFRGGSFRAYIGRIARNQCYDALRKKRAQRGPFVDLPEDDWPVHDRTPEDITVSRETISEVQDILEGLNQTDREILLLRHVHQFSYDEIAAVVGLRAGTIRTRISRARQRIMEEMEKREKRETLNLG
jgi:RNA polymerase sigma-70 factor (ECF subfamily)